MDCYRSDLQLLGWKQQRSGDACGDDLMPDSEVCLWLSGLPAGRVQGKANICAREKVSVCACQSAVGRCSVRQCPQVLAVKFAVEGG